MSVLTDQIKAKCATIAENQKKVYDLGFEKGKASVKHITFCVNGESFCAVSGMTWREYVASGMGWNFTIKNDQIYFWGNPLGYSADDEIVDEGYYETLAMFSFSYNSQSYDLYCYEEQPWEYWVDSEFNTIGLYFDNNNYLRTPTGEYVFANTGDDSYTLQVDKWSGIEWSEYKAKAVSMCNIVYETIAFDAGMTWEDYVNSSYNAGVYIDGDFVHHYAGDTDKAYYYNGVQVKPTDLMIDGATYEYK